ncbi:Flp family type IVb pilin [Microbacterium sp. SD291]|uniref:Flp family type IVb pilin n=1 Tax=Microbacterium sp. SD291 TaxID=2782007 RepID=UPI001A96A63D|nr:Flp family type IVb pilin [Microbacterium sp. SD291]MBO0980867.1 Flp family type IVb pilin [Microbacterium sp. SD291]
MLKAFTKAQAFVNSLREEEEGATAVEYGLIVALIAAVIIAVVILLGGEIRQAFQTIVDGIPGGPAAP